MTMTQGMEYIAQLNMRGSVPGLQNIRVLLDKLGHPECRVPVIHIAGTNGKGSTLAFIEAICRRAGLTVGRYTSPTIESYYERFQIDGENITEEVFEKLLMQVKVAADRMEQEMNLFPTAFEVETAVAFLYCGQADVMLLETGMGGRLDSTNVVPEPLVTVLASISMDHMQFLGNTIEEIAREKAGILRQSVACVSSPANARNAKLEQTIMDCCAQAKALYVTDTVDEVLESDTEHTVFLYQDEQYEIHLPGLFQVDNAVTAILAVREVVSSWRRFHWQTGDGAKHWQKAAISLQKTDTIREGLAAATWPVRFERVKAPVEIYLDGAHNEDACIRLRESVERFFKGRYIIYIIGVLKDKEYGKMMGLMAPSADEIYTVTPDNPRALPAEQLAGVCEQYCGQVKKCTSIGHAYVQAKGAFEQMKACKPVIIAFGSLSYLGELKRCIGGDRHIQSQENMDRFNQLLQDDEVIAYYDRLAILEENRIYCRHGLNHALDVARIGYIMMLEMSDLVVSKEIFYVTALLHDLGRVMQYEQGTPHHEAGVLVAEKLLSKYAFTDKEKTDICQAIAAHRDAAGGTGFRLAEYLYLADKQSRNCFCCEAADSCNWSEEKKNYELSV